VTEVLVDTSVWIGHLCAAEPALVDALDADLVLTHPFVVGEIVCGALRDRDEVLGLMSRLPSAPVAGHEEALHMLDSHRLWGRGLGWVDVHLLASASLGASSLWTADRRLAEVAREIGVSPPT
jgi:predicted nucleic acid-binding protein